MNSTYRFSLKRAVAIFAGLAIVFAALLIAAGSVSDELAQLVLVSVGSAIFGAGLAFFLIRITGLDDTR